jgi:hypothetical protein
MKERIIVTGASGLVGESLCKLLYDNGFDVAILSRSDKSASKYPIFKWDLENGYIDDSLFDQKIDYIIHLAGSPIADKKWSDDQKKEIISSRVDSINLLAKYLEIHNCRPKAFISASAIGIYGNSLDDQILNEYSVLKKESTEFLVQTCLKWEAATENIKKLGVRTAILRIGIVLSEKGGALAKMLPSYRFGLGAYFGNGKQYYSWIHIDDICKMFLFLIRSEKAEGVYNGVAPNPITNKELAADIAKARDQKALLLPVPKVAMKIAMGEMAVIVLDSTRVEPKRMLEAGFEFSFPEALAALKDLLKR